MFEGENVSLSNHVCPLKPLGPYHSVYSIEGLKGDPQKTGKFQDGKNYNDQSDECTVVRGVLASFCVIMCAPWNLSDPITAFIILRGLRGALNLARNSSETIWESCTKVLARVSMIITGRYDENNHILIIFIHFGLFGWNFGGIKQINWSYDKITNINHLITNTFNHLIIFLEASDCTDESQ